MLKFLVSASVLFLVAVGVSSASMKNLTEFIPWDKIEAEDFSVAYGINGGALCDNANGISSTGTDHYAGYYDVDFEDGAELVTFRLNGPRPDLELGYIYLRLGGADAEPVASIPVSSTGSVDPKCNFIIITSFLPTLIAGVQDLYLTFDSSTGDGIVRIDWFRFTKRYV